MNAELAPVTGEHADPAIMLRPDPAGIVPAPIYSKEDALLGRICKGRAGYSERAWLGLAFRRAYHDESMRLQQMRDLLKDKSSDKSAFDRAVVDLAAHLTFSGKEVQYS